MRGGGVRRAPAMRPMQPGELLDAAVLLFRARAWPLLLLAAPLLALEQVAVWAAGASGLDVIADFPLWWRVLATFLACEAVTVPLLGAYAGAAAGSALIGSEVSGRALLKRTRPLPVVVTVLLPALLAAPAAYFGLLGWFAVHGLLGLSGVVLTLDRTGWPFGALGRSVLLAARLGGRGFWNRVWGYLVWLGIRVALTAGPVLFLWQAGLVADGYLGDWLVLAAWGLAGTVSCAVLACLDAVQVIDTRIRTEGLDITLRRASATGADLTPLLAHRRPRDAAPAQFPAQPAVPPWPQALVRPSAPAGLSRQAQVQWMQAEARARHREHEQ